MNRPIVCLVALLACGLAPARSEILVGAALPLTGPSKAVGQATRDGIELAVDDLNAKGGLLGERLGLLVEDDACTAERATAAANILVDGGVQVVVGHPCSGAAIAASDVYEDKRDKGVGVVLVSNLATNTKLTDRDRSLVFRVVGRDDQQGELAAAYLAEHFAGRRIAILHDTQTYGAGLARLMKRSLRDLDIGEVMEAGLDPEAVEYLDVVREMQAKGVEVIYYAGYAEVGGRLRQQSWNLGLRVPMLTGDGLADGDYWDTVERGAAEWTLTSFPPDPRDRPEAADVAADVTAALLAKREEVRPQMLYALHAYAAVQAWAQAVQAADTTEGGTVARTLRAGTFRTVMGPIGFDGKGDLVGPAAFVWYIWRGGTYVELDPGGWRRRWLVCRAQAGLRALRDKDPAYDVGPIDGIAGKRTRKALDAFVKAQGRRLYFGTIDAPLVAAIERDAGARARAGWEHPGRLCRTQVGLIALGSLDEVLAMVERAVSERMPELEPPWKGASRTPAREPPP